MLITRSFFRLEQWQTRAIAIHPGAVIIDVVQRLINFASLFQTRLPE